MKAPKFTLAEARQALKWAVARLGLEAWQFHLDICDEPPEWASDDDRDGTDGLISYSCNTRTVQLWVSPARSAETSIWRERFNLARDHEPYASFFHELGHVALEDAGCDSGKAEFFLNGLGAMMAKLYFAERKEKARR